MTGLLVHKHDAFTRMPEDPGAVYYLLRTRACDQVRGRSLDHSRGGRRLGPMQARKRAAAGSNSAIAARLPALRGAGICCRARRRVGVENNKHRDPYDPRRRNRTRALSGRPSRGAVLRRVRERPQHRRARQAHRSRRNRGRVQARHAPARLDVRARHRRRHRRGHRPRLRGRRRRSALHADPGHAGRRCPGSRDGVAQVQLTMHEHDGTPFFGDPRHLLGERARRDSRALGLTPVVAIEYEFYLVDTRARRATASRSRRGARSPAGANTARRSTR